MTIRSRVIVLNSKGEVFVVKHRPENKFWALPGGRLDNGETTRECIIREIQEELGVTLKNPELKFIVENIPVESMEFFFFEETDTPEAFVEGRGDDHYELAGQEFVDIENDDIIVMPPFLKGKMKNIKTMEGVEYIIETGPKVIYK
ncbi:MAG: NUDIX domain-containing protein [Candidatus Gracilibacteria bacterium]